MRTDLDTTLLRGQAARYDLAIQALSEIKGMRLDDLDQLKQATAIVERAGYDLKFAGHKLAVLARDDAHFMGSLRQACPDRNAALALVKSARADPTILSQLRGADILALRIQQSIRIDAAVVTGIARQLKEVAQEIKPQAIGRRAPTPASRTPAPAFPPLFKRYPGVGYSPLDVFFTFALIGQLMAMVAVDGPEGRAIFECIVMSQCMNKLQDEWSACLAKARQTPPGNRKAERDQAALEAEYAADFLDLPFICANFAVSAAAGTIIASPNAFPSFTCYGFPAFVPIDPLY